MLRDLLSWVLYSPARLLAVALTGSVLTLVGVTWPWGDDASAPDPTAAPSRVVEPLPSPSTSVDSAEEVRPETRAPVGEIRSTARAFVAAYVVMPEGATPPEVPTSLRGLATPSLWRGLRLADPELLPRGRIAQLVVDEAGPYSGRVVVELRTGLALEVSLVAWDRRWRVSDVQPGNRS